ncbi:DUF3231 family protein [Paenibacillus solisilvae]|uniref:DUF3231 family protein n=1 Tax=Paenibacillus solisilvae TaxID=2486751 RepID=A0ABW0VXX3_9BACL
MKEKDIRLTSTEMGALWATYVNDTMARCVLSYFHHIVEDSEITSVVKYALDLSDKQIQELTKIFNAEDFPIPKGFSDEDVNVNVKRLFSDSFFLYYIKNMAKVGLVTYSMTYTMASRSDIRSFFHDTLLKTVKLDQKVTEVLQSKGLYIRPPYMPIPDGIDFVENKNFLSGGFFGFLDKRPLISIEIAHLFANAQTNGLGKTMLMGFNQVARSQEIRKYFSRGVDISTKHVKIFADILKDDELPVPMTWDSDVMDSTEAPFSDKLMLYHVSLLIAAGTGNYGIATAASPRRDVAANYIRLAAEIASYAEDGAKMLIEHGWLEEPPQAPDRKELMKT